MANKKDEAKAIIIIFSVLSGIVLAFLIKSNLDGYTPMNSNSLIEIQEDISTLEGEIKELELIYKDRNRQLKRLEDKINPARDIEREILEELSFRKTKSGYSSIEGPGIEIKMYDNQDTEIVGYSVNDDIIHDIDILNILNDLKIAGAEAISINGERILSSSEIKCGGPIIKVNNKSLATPFVIKAVGDTRTLMAAVLAPGTYGDTLKNVYSIGFEPKEKENIVIPAYKKEVNFRYARPKGEADN